MNNYDVIIVGTGPCGYMCAYKLITENPNLKIICVDQGLDISERPVPGSKVKIDRKKNPFANCSITSGFGGAGAFSDGKFNVTTEFGGWLGNYISDDEVMRLINYCDEINLKFGGTKTIIDPFTDEVKKIEQKAIGAGLLMLRARVRHLGTDGNYHILTEIRKFLGDKGVAFLFKTKVLDILVHNDEVQGIKLANGEEIHGKRVVMGVGREGATFLSHMLRSHNVRTLNNRVDIGVRVETSNIVMQDINKNLYEGKFLYHTSQGTIVRTFCSNPSGHVVMEKEDDVILANGHSYANPKLGSRNTNFALLVSHEFSEPFNDPNQFAKDVASLANRLACGGVILQRYGDLKLGRRSTPKRIQEGFVVPTLKDAVPGDLSLCMPYKTLKSIMEMIEALNYVTPGIANEHTLLYGVEAKFYSDRPEVGNDLQTKKIKNLYCGGDGAGITRGLAQASASGVLIAENILSSLEKE